MAITGIGHTAFACHDPEASLASYQTLGIRESFRLVHDDGRVRLIYLRIAGDRFVELFPGGPPPGGDGNTTYKRIYLLTDDIKALAAIVVIATAALSRLTRAS